MSYKIAVTRSCQKDIKRLLKKHRSIIEDISQLGELLAENPRMGDEVIENCYKVRLAISSKNRGKSGGARVITYVYVLQETVFLLSIYDKSEQSDVENNEIRELIADLELNN